MKYKIPNELGNVKQLIKRFDTAKKARSPWISHLQECYEYALPQRETFTRHTPGARKNKSIYDSTVVLGVQSFASRLQATLIPPWRQWSILVPGSGIPEKEHAGVQKHLDSITKIVFDHINHSNFATQSHEAFLDLSVSTGVLQIQQSEGLSSDSDIEFHAAPLAEIYPEAGPHGTIETVWRSHKVPARHIDRLWPGASLSDKIRKTATDAPDTRVELIEGTIYVPKQGDYYQCVIDRASDHIVFAQSFEVSPWVVFREYVVPGEVLGRGRVMQVLPDVKTANKVVEYTLRNAALSISGVYTATDDGVINPYNVRLEPGTILPVGSNDSSNPSLRPLARAGDVNMAVLVLNDLRNNINKALFAEPFGEITQPVHSATEMALRNQELVQNSGSAFGRMQTEFIEKIIKRTVSILKSTGKIPPFNVDGKEVTIKHTSPLARAQDQDDLVALNQYLATVAQLGPEILNLAVKTEDMPAWIAKRLGVEQKLIRDEAEKAQIKEQMAQMMQQQAPEMANAAA